MCPEKRLALLVVSFFLAFAFLSGHVSAQSKKKTPAKKPAATAKADNKKKAASAKDARNSRTAKSNSRDKKASAKESRSSKNSRNNKTDSRSAKNDPRSKKLSRKEQARLDAQAKKDARTAKNDKRGKRETKKETAERRRREAEARAAALAERRRREAAARAARERFLAFERGLRTETVENIAKDNTEGEDLRIRQTAIDALGNRAGTVVVMESQTGKVLTIVNQDWAIKNGFKPCSTIKLVTGVAGVNENVINNEGDIVGDNSPVNLNTALAFSKNPYFQRVGVKVGNAKMIDYARSLGLGQKTGINAEGETPGKLPYGNSNPRIYSHGDDFEVTPLQLAVMVSALSNGGNKVVPHISKPSIERSGFRTQYNGRIDIPQERYQQVLPGMMGAAEFGTAHRGVDASLGIAGKTGSCITRGSWIGLFASVAPVEKPKYAVVVITRGHSERGKWAASVAGKIYHELAPRLVRDRERYMALKNQAASSIDTRTATADDEDDDSEDAAETNTAQQQEEVFTVTAEPRIEVPVQQVVKKVVKTADSKPVFAPVVIPFRKDGKPIEPSTSRPRVVKNEK
jgi:membrane peptidoglycan carboxypeptidase